MNTEFKLFGGEIIPDVQQYVRQFTIDHPDVDIYIGADSQTYKRHIEFASVICFQFPNKGVHIIFRREKVMKKELKVGTPDDKHDWKNIIFKKLWKEVEMSLEAALLIRDYTDKEITVDLDFNGNSAHESNMVYDAGRGYIIANGFKCRLKPHAWAASSAADDLLR